MTLFSYHILFFILTIVADNLPDSNQVEHGDECDSDDDDVCETATFCLYDFNKTKRCLCDTEHYRSDDNECVPTIKLVVSNITTKNVSPNSITLSWSNQSFNETSARFKVSNETSLLKLINANHFTVDNLKSNTLYKFSVTVYIPQNKMYSVIYGPPTPHQAQTTTTKEYGEMCKDNCQTGSGIACLLNPNNELRCICDENHYFTDSRECMSTEMLTVSDIKVTEITTTSITLSWTNKTINKLSARFKISYGENCNLYSNKNEVKVMSLETDTTYTFIIKVHIPQEMNYGHRYGPTTKTQIKTSPETTVPEETSTSSTNVSSSETNSNSTAFTNPPRKETTSNVNYDVSLIAVGVVLSLALMTFIILSAVYVRQRRRLNGGCKTKTSEDVNKIDIHISHLESEYSQVDTFQKRNSSAAQRKSKNIQDKLDQVNESKENNLNEKQPIERYANDNKISERLLPVLVKNGTGTLDYNNLDISENVSTDGVYSHLAHCSIGKRDETENVYNG